MYISFKNRTMKFWKAFEEEEATIREMMDRDVDAKILRAFTESIFKIAFNEIQFEIGKSLNGKYELTLTPQGNRVRLIQYNYWLNHCPTHLLKTWNILTSKPALRTTKFQIEMFGITLEDDDLILYPRINYEKSRIELEVYCPKLMNKLSESQRYSIFFAFLDEHISELYTIEHVSNIQFIKKKLEKDELNIKSLKLYIDSTIHENGWTNSTNPLDGYLGYKVQSTDKTNWLLREDISAGYSSCTSPISAYHFKDNSFFEEYKKDGIIFGFLFFENIDISEDEVVQFRASVEDKIIAQTTNYGISDCIGGATGFHFSYIDFIIYDYEPFIKTVKEVMSKYSFEEVGFSYFKSGSVPIMLAEVTL